MNHDTREKVSYDFKRIHLCGLAWFLVCVIFLVVIAIDQMGFHWWVVFSVSGYSAIVVLFLTTVYLFAFYKGVVRNSNSIEYPLTTSPYYILLYDSAPFLGSAVAFFVVSYNESLSFLLIVAAQGALIMTFVMWIITDPLVGLIEASFPQSIAHRKKRLAENQQKKQEQIQERQKMLEQISQQEKQSQFQWSCFFQPYAIEVADLLCNPSVSMEASQRRIIELGALAWRRGELLGMKFFHQIILDELKGRRGYSSADFVALYWDGIGAWRKPTKIEQMYI